MPPKKPLIDGVSPDADARAKAKAEAARRAYATDDYEDDDDRQTDLEEYVDDDDNADDEPEHVVRHPRGSATDERDDIFSYCARLVLKDGIPVEYVIRKDGKRLCTIPHPYSWDEIQAEYGAGNYKVSARHAVEGYWLRHQIEPLAEGKKPKEPEEPKGNGHAEPPPRESESDRFMQMMTLMDRKERQAREDADKRMGMQISMFQKMMESQSAQNQAMMTAIVSAIGGKHVDGENGSMRTVVELLNGQNTNLQTTINQLYTMLIEKGQSKNEMGKYADPMTLLELVRDSEDRGFTRMKTMMELSDEKAKERALMMAPASAKDEDDSDKPIYQQLIEAALPGLKQAFSGGGEAPAQIPPQAPPRQLPPRPVQGPARTMQGAVSGGSGPAPFRGQNPNTAPRPGQASNASARPGQASNASARPGQGTNAPGHAPATAHNAGSRAQGAAGANQATGTNPSPHQAGGPVGADRGPGRGSVEAVSRPTRLMGLPTIGAKTPKPVKPKAVEVLGKGDEPMNNVDPARVGEVQALLIQIISPNMKDWLLKQADTGACAANTLTAVQNAGVSYGELFAAFPHPEVLTNIAHRLGVPKIADRWLNKYYADLKRHAAHESSGGSQG